MKLTFIGADHEVTGSCHMIEACGKVFLIDCGMEQGTNLYENIEIPVKPSDIDYVFLTHAHIDHSGMIPKLYKDGFKGQIYTTTATHDLCKVMLMDSAHIQEQEAEWHNRKAMRSGAPQYEPVYDTNDAAGALNLFVPCDYEAMIHVCEGITVRFRDVGHLLGSASIEFWLKEGDIEKKIVFSGDIGNVNQPIIRDPICVEDADYAVMESTYGDRSHGEIPDYVSEFTDILQTTFDRGGNVVVPSFAVGRTQEILYFVREIKQKKLLHGHDDFEVYVDSPLAVEATTIFDKHSPDCYDEEAAALVKAGVKPLIFPGLKYSVTSDESKMINFMQQPKLIISASGMCDAGRIRHHLKHNLWRKECTVLFVGYQSVGTLGRKLLEGEKQVKLFGEDIEVNAEIRNLTGISGHADMNGLLKWVEGFEKKPEQIFVVHGDDTVTDEFARMVTEKFGIPAMAPFSGGMVDLATGEILSEGTPVRITDSKKPFRKKAAQVFQRLLAAGQRLMAIIRKSEGMSNKDLANMETQINNLCDKWEKDLVENKEARDE